VKGSNGHSREEVPSTRKSASRGKGPRNSTPTRTLGYEDLKKDSFEIGNIA
jgi:hypothetical protein